MQDLEMVQAPKTEDVLESWKKAQPLPPDAETMEMGKVNVKSMPSGELLFWKIRRTEKEEFLCILAVHKTSPPEAVIPVGMMPFKDEVSLHLFVNNIKDRAMQEWMRQWWREDKAGL
jgi:hypothetical protein